MYKEPFLLMWPESSEYREDSAESGVNIKICILFIRKTSRSPLEFTLCGVVVLALLPQHCVGDLFEGGVKAPAARLILPGWIDGLVLQELRRRAPQRGIPFQASLQKGAHGGAAVLRYVFQRRGLLVYLLGDR